MDRKIQNSPNLFIQMRKSFDLLFVRNLYENLQAYYWF